MHNVNADAAKHFCPQDCQQDRLCLPTPVEVCACVCVCVRACVRVCTDNVFLLIIN